MFLPRPNGASPQLEHTLSQTTPWSREEICYGVPSQPRFPHSFHISSSGTSCISYGEETSLYEVQPHTHAQYTELRDTLVQTIRQRAGRRANGGSVESSWWSRPHSLVARAGAAQWSTCRTHPVFSLTKRWSVHALSELRQNFTYKQPIDKRKAGKLTRYKLRNPLFPPRFQKDLHSLDLGICSSGILMSTGGYDWGENREGTDLFVGW